MRSFRILLVSYFFWFAANALDIWSSWGFQEANELMRDPVTLMFNLAKAIHIKLVFTGYYLLLSFAVWLITRPLDKELAVWLAAFVPLASTFDLFHTALSNYLG